MRIIIESFCRKYFLVTKMMVLIANVASAQNLALVNGDILRHEPRIDEPFGSRYLDYDINKVWLPHAGRYTDGGWVSSKYPRYVEDITNDGMADVVAFGENDIWVAISDGSKFGSFYSAIGNFGYGQAWRVDKDPRFIADLNNDGFKDIIGYGIQGVYCALNNRNTTNPQFNQFKLWLDKYGQDDRNGFYLNPAFIRTTLDMNADGKSDLVVFADDGVYVALSNGNNFNAPTRWISDFGTNLLWNNTEYKRYIADINGDGYNDILGYGIQGVWAALNNKSNAFTQFKLWSDKFGKDDRNGFYLNSDFIRTVGDVNGDGKADLVVFADDGVYTSLSSGNGFDVPQKWSSKYGTNSGAGSWNNTDYLRVLADVNADKKVDIVGFASTGTDFSMSVGYTFSDPQTWITDFGYQQEWRNGEDPRFLRDVNGDGILDVTGYGYYGVYISESAPLYAADRTYYYDSNHSNWVKNGWFVRVHLPRILDQVVMPQRNAGVCGGANLNLMHPVGKNTSGPYTWINQSWREQLGARFMVNANFFQIPPNPYTDECGTGLGLSISDSQLLSPYNTFDGYETDVLLVYNAATASQHGFAASIQPGSNVDWQGKAQFAISGMRLVKNGQAVSSQPDAVSQRARNSVGLTRDGNTLIFLTQNNGQDGGNESTSLPALAKALIDLGAYNALNLDGSGSAQMWFKNNQIEFKSLPSDIQSWAPNRSYRPVPIVFGVK